ncbi:MAG: dihydroorotate dehydrogenase electron transfer subunit, partial [Candidatus Helarchaeales archaeon]
TEKIVAIEFKLPKGMNLPKPGQFFMIWLPGLDEIPISISRMDEINGVATLMVKNVGEATSALAKTLPGEKIGIRGPFGNGFKMRGSRPILIGGGIGAAPLMMLADSLKLNGIKSTFLNGARNASELIYLKEIPEITEKHYFTTDDGSLGFKGLVTEKARELLSKHEFDQVYACGPEKMLKELLNITLEYNIPLQASLERIFKCGMGLCGHCVLDPSGLLTCKDGPVFSTEDLVKITDFGRFKRDFNGSKITI